MSPRTEQRLRQTVTGKVTNTTLYQNHNPYALLQDEHGNQESVRILGMGDVEGKSPCYLFVGEDGIPSWESTGKFTIIDPSLLPASREALMTLARALNNTTTESTR